MVLYTDGVTEATNPQGEEFGRERLVHAVRAAAGGSARGLITSLQDEVLSWTDGKGASDDITFFVIKALPLNETGDRSLP